MGIFFSSDAEKPAAVRVGLATHVLSHIAEDTRKSGITTPPGPALAGCLGGTRCGAIGSPSAKARRAPVTHWGSLLP